MADLRVSRRVAFGFEVVEDVLVDAVCGNWHRTLILGNGRAFVKDRRGGAFADSKAASPIAPRCGRRRTR